MWQIYVLTCGWYYHCTKVELVLLISGVVSQNNRCNVKDKDLSQICQPLRRDYVWYLSTQQRVQSADCQIWGQYINCSLDLPTVASIHVGFSEEGITNNLDLR